MQPKIVLKYPNIVMEKDCDCLACKVMVTMVNEVATNKERTFEEIYKAVMNLSTNIGFLIANVPEFHLPPLYHNAIMNMLVTYETNKGIIHKDQTQEIKNAGGLQ